MFGAGAAFGLLADGFEFAAEVVEQEIEDGGGHCFDFNVWGRRMWRKSRVTFLLQG